MFKTTYTANNLADDVKRRFGDESGVQVTNTDIIRWINAGQIEIAAKNRILKATGQLPVLKNQNKYQFAADMNIQYIQAIYYNKERLTYRSFNEATDMIQNASATGTPQFWYDWGADFYLYPTPSEDAMVTIYYHPIPAPIVSLDQVLQIPDNYYNRLIEFVMSQAYELDENLQAQQLKMQQFDGGMTMMLKDEASQNVDVYPSITVREEDQW